MSSLIHCKSISKSFGSKALFNDLTISLNNHDRIGIIGPNGSGKTTLIKIMAGHETVDTGIVTRRNNIRVAYVTQQPTFDIDASVSEIVEHVAKNAGISTAEIIPRVRETLGKVGFHNSEQSVALLSGGWKKRLAIACAFVQNPDVMLLDEPTNHLDFEGMQWLSKLMTDTTFAWLMVSHDRWFLEKSTNFVAELNSQYPSGIFISTGSYSDFLLRREEYREAQTQQAQTLSGKVKREVDWLRRGPKARTTKAKSRVESAHALQETLENTTARLRQSNTKIDFVGSDRKTKNLITVKDLGKKFTPNPLFAGMDMVLSPSMKLGLLGHNGSGKSTLLKLLAKLLQPDHGTITHADSLKVVYFDQNREQLDPTCTLREALLDSGDHVSYRGRTMHIISWANRFQFRPEQLDLRVHCLSGGEQARTVIARLMLKPADVLLLDEPSNDLDIPTLEILEESIKDFPGAVVLVTHDRYLLTQTCTTFMGFDGIGNHAHFADYYQWENWLQVQYKEKNKTPKLSPKGDTTRVKSQTKKLSYKEQKEYDSMEEKILEAETTLEDWRTKTQDPMIATKHIELEQTYNALHEAEKKVHQLYTRWEALEEKLQGKQ